jgi:DNA-binding GntR family transcriptional regulator
MQVGLVTQEPHRGSVVAVLTERDLVDIYIAREGIERRAVQLILERGATVDLRAVRRAVATLRAAPRGARPTFAMVEADVAFHEAVVAAAGSPRLHRMFRTLSAETQMYLLQTHPPYDPETYVLDHERLAEAIVERRDDAPDLIEEHLRHSRSVIVRAMAHDAGNDR